jgi:hypothetical protein
VKAAKWEYLSNLLPKVYNYRSNRAHALLEVTSKSDHINSNPLARINTDRSRRLGGP